MTTTVYLIRHGETLWNLSGLYQGHRDSDLSPRGRLQVSALARRFAGRPLDLVLTSDLKRAHTTAAALIPSGGKAPFLEVDARLRERSYGRWEGLSADLVRARFAADWQAYRADPLDARPTEGESVRELARRASAALDERLTRPGVRRLAVVTHGGTVKVLVCHLLQWPLEFLHQLRVDNASVTKIELRPSQPPLLHYLNDTGHLRQQALLESTAVRGLDGSAVERSSQHAGAPAVPVRARSRPGHRQ